MSYLASSRNECIPFYVDYKQVGIVLPDVALLLQEHPEIFTVSSTAIHLNNKYGSCEERTEIMRVFLNGLREAGHLNKALKGWRNEVRLKICGPNRFTSYLWTAMLRSLTPAKKINTNSTTNLHTINASTQYLNKGYIIWFGERVIKNVPDKFDKLKKEGTGYLS